MRNNCRNRIRSERSRLLDLESHVVSIRDCLQRLFDRFHTPASTDCLWTNKFSVLIVNLSVISGFQLKLYHILLS